MDDGLLVTGVPIGDWGKDHWSLLAYVESRAVDHHGYLDGRHMRGGVYAQPGDDYPTRLRGYFDDKSKAVHGHTDYDCVQDMVVAGLVEPYPGTTGGRGRVPWAEIEARYRRDGHGRFKRPSLAQKYETTRFRLTSRGHALAAQLRAHKAGGGNFSEFVPDLAAVAA